MKFCILSVKFDSDFSIKVQFSLNSLDSPFAFCEAYKNKLLNVPEHICWIIQ